MGIITKPDLINVGMESCVMRLVNNLDSIKLNLGFFLVKNPLPADLERGVILLEHQKAELEFFLTRA
jgi:hypothetical protein